jgi:hypothetical protein
MHSLNGQFNVDTKVGFLASMQRRWEVSCRE